MIKSTGRTLIKKFLIPLLLVTSQVVYAAQSDSLINRLSVKPFLWYRADSAGSTAGLWQNYVDTSHTLTLDSTAIFETGSMNFHPALLRKLSDEPFKINYYPPKRGKARVFIVYMSSDTMQEDGLWSLVFDTLRRCGLTTHRIIGRRRDIKYADTTMTIPIINYLSHSWRLRGIDSNMAGLYLAGTDSFALKGKIAEIMYFDKKLNRRDEELIHSYLAIKYGITIGRYNYISSQDSIVWNTKDNSTYNHDVAGIARDEGLDLYQKQASGKGGKSAVTMYLATLTQDNAANEGQMSDNTWIIWGDNAKAMRTKSDSTAHDSLKVSSLIEREWKVEVRGDSARYLNTNLMLNAEGLDSNATVKLVIKPRFNMEYWTDSVLIIAPDSSDAAGKVYYSGLQWDMDGSGSDMFTFKIDTGASNMSYYMNNTLSRKDMKQDEKMKVRLFPNPNAGEFSLQIYCNRQSNISVEVTDVEGKMIKKERYTTQRFIWLKEKIETPGVYFVRITDGKETIVRKVVVK